jgi:hypothetical protein
VGAGHILRVHLVPVLGDRRLSEIDSASIQRLKPGLARAGAQPKTVDNILSVLRKLLKVAVDWEVLEQIPCAIPRVRFAKKAQPYYTFAEFGRLVEERRRSGATST